MSPNKSRTFPEPSHLKLARQPVDTTVLEPVLKLVDRRVIETTGSKLVVMTVRFDQKQYIDAASAVLSLLPKQCRHRSNDSDHEYMFITVPACVIEHAFPVEAAHFAELATEVVVVSRHWNYLWN